MIDPVKCPYCDSYDWSLVEPKSQTPHFHVLCQNCLLRGPSGHSRDNAVNHWNRLGEFRWFSKRRLPSD